MKQCWSINELDALQADVDALKRLQAKLTAELDAMLPAILPSSLRFAATSDRAFKGEL